MDVSRRQFLRSTAAAAAVALPLDLPGQRWLQWERPLHGCAVLDLGNDCPLRESLSGFECALAATAATWTRTDAQSLSPCAMLIVPGAGRIQTSVARLIARRLESGATVILESGAVFAADECDLSADRRVLRDSLGLELGPPIGVWSGASSSRGLPYVEYTWPTAAVVRDFSRAIPLAEPQGASATEIVARIGDVPVASKRRLGAGLLIFLGSPLGPALRTGDADARRWLAAVISGSHGLPRP